MMNTTPEEYECAECAGCGLQVPESSAGEWSYRDSGGSLCPQCCLKEFGTTRPHNATCNECGARAVTSYSAIFPRDGSGWRYMPPSGMLCPICRSEMETG